MKKLRKKYLRFYTMVELMVTTAAIAALASLLLPGLERAKGIAKKVYCLNNVKQIGIAANCYWHDKETLPYSSTWLIDFSFVSNYMDYYDALACPDTDDAINTAADLNGNTSYHYMGSRDDWIKNNEVSGDGSEYGFDATNETITDMLSGKEQRVIYDRTDLVHNKHFNVLFLDSMHTESVDGTRYGDFCWYYADTGTLDFTCERERNRNRNRYRNNGHGNNEDGVDCSNPGASGEDDPSGDVDDEM